MPFDAPAEPSMFPEAEAYFRQLVPVSAAEWERMTTEERGKAFSVAGSMQLDAVQYLHDEISKAIQTGEGFDAWSKRVSERLRSDFAEIKSHKLETIFRTNVQDAYGVGRWYQQQDPEVTAVRPWMLFDTVEDSRRSPICTDMADPPLVKRHDDPYVAAHWPPLHHRCRSQWQSISNRRARQLGGETQFLDEPREQPSEGFGLAPPLRSDWRPDEARYNPDLWKIHEQKVAELKAQL